MAVHVLSPQNGIARKELCAHPFIQNTLTVCDSLTMYDHQVYHYGAEGSKVSCDEHIDVISVADLDKAYGDLHKNFGALQLGGVGDYAYDIADTRMFHEVMHRIDEGDYVIAMWNGHANVTNRIQASCEFPVTIIEGCCCYMETFATYRVFPSKSFQAFKYGMFHQLNDTSHETNEERYNPENWKATSNPYSFVKYGDTVIPLHIDTNNFALQAEKEDYLCYVGRIIYNKGVYTAVKLAEDLGLKLKIAGAGDYVSEFNQPVPSHVEILGMVDIEERNELMGKALAGICLPRYLEPGGFTAGEYGACGTAVICPNIGGVSEIVVDGVTGYHCHDYQDAKNNLKKIDKINPEACRRHIEDNYNIDIIAEKYDRYLTRLDALIQGEKTNNRDFYTYS